MEWYWQSDQLLNNLKRINEEKVIRALERLEKLDFGRIQLFGSGRLSARINGGWYRNEFTKYNIECDGGDGGD